LPSSAASLLSPAFPPLPLLSPVFFFPLPILRSPGLLLSSGWLSHTIIHCLGILDHPGPRIRSDIPPAATPISNRPALISIDADMTVTISIATQGSQSIESRAGSFHI
jgi:hypothetical protein